MTRTYALKTEVIQMADGSNMDLVSAYSTLDGGYIGNEKTAKMLEGRGIAPQMRTEGGTCSIGFCEREQKWYGWSHRAIYGFGVGSTCKKGDCGYVGSTPEELIDDRSAFFADIGADVAQQRRDECQILPDRSGIRILITPIRLPAISLDQLRDTLKGDHEPEMQTLFENSVRIVKCGRGEWTAKTLEGAKQMASDFAEGVS